MAVPKKISKGNLQRLKFIEKSADSLDVSAKERQDIVFNKLKRMIQSLDINEDGTIKQTASNINAVQKFTKIRNLVVDKQYKKAVKSYLGKFNKVKDQTDNYFKNLPDNA